MVLDDKFARTVRLPVKYVKGQWQMYDGAGWPEMRDGAFAELVLDAFSIDDDAVRAMLCEEREVLFLPKDSCLWAKVDGRQVPSDLKNAAVEKPCWPPQYLVNFVQIVLEEDLCLVFRKNKHAKLRHCKCKVPGLKAEGDSVNHAYALVSTRFEPSRRSHTGNVFLCVYYEDGEDLKPLDELRLKTLDKVEATDSVREAGTGHDE